MASAGWQLRGYTVTTRAAGLVAPRLLLRRLARGKEDPNRWTEKLGTPTAARPKGRLVWMHAVGLGEVMALRGLIGAMQDLDRKLNVLVTSTARSGAEVFAKSAPDRTLHQYLPLDVPRYLQQFLDHWQPNLSIWSEQDIWPGAIYVADRAEVPLALVNGRMNAQSHARRARARGLYRDVLGRFALMSAQDEATAQHLADLGGGHLRVDGPLKAAAPDLPADPQSLQRLTEHAADRSVWLLASSHPEDEAQALNAVRPDDLLIIAPRDITRGDEIAAKVQAQGLTASLRSVVGDALNTHVYVADTFGEMGLWYRLAKRAVIGGTFGQTEGHNPWEAAALGCAILHGPRVANFASDFALLQSSGAAVSVKPDGLGPALESDMTNAATAARQLVDHARAGLHPLARDLVGLIR